MILGFAIWLQLFFIFLKLDQILMVLK